jgi:ornithine cyclodeaminase/alanine dehydrogenase-like protein (mu-crystallin family)
VSAVATKNLAREDAKVLALIGSGVQARSHLKALRLVRDFEDIRVWSPHHAKDFDRDFGPQQTTPTTSQLHDPKHRYNAPCE